MGKHKKNKKVADHRNYGFDAKDALYEHNAETTKLINRQITTKEGLHIYTDDEAEAKGGAVTEYNYNLKYSWTEFKSMPRQNQREYVNHLKQKYEGLRITDLANMFGVNGQNLRNILHLAGVKFNRGGAYHTAGREQFRKDMLDHDSIFPCSEPVPEQTESVYDVHRLSVVCDADEAHTVMQRFGIRGKIYLTIERMDEKEVV